MAIKHSLCEFALCEDKSLFCVLEDIWWPSNTVSVSLTSFTSRKVKKIKTDTINQSQDDSVIILDVDEEDNNQYASIDELLMPSEDEMDQNITRGGHHISVEGVPQSLDDSVVILDVDEEERYTSSDDLLMSDAEFDHSRGEHQRGKEGGPNGLDDSVVTSCMDVEYNESDYEVITID